MAAHRTEQERIDDMTMKILHPNVVGSGYISFPPQQRFEKPLLVQPPTISHLEYPDEWKGPNGVPRPGAPSQPVTAPMVRTSVAAGGPAVRPPAHVPQVMQASVRPPAANAPVYRPMAQASPQMAGPNSGQGSVPGRVPAPAPGRGQAAPGRGPAPAMAAGRGQAPAMAAGRGSMPGRGPAPGRGMAPAPGQGGPAPGRGAPAPGRVAAVAAAPVKTALPAKPDAAATAAAAMELSKSLAAKAAVEDADDDADKSGLTAAQKKRLRKKMREGKA